MIIVLLSLNHNSFCWFRALEFTQISASLRVSQDVVEVIVESKVWHFRAVPQLFHSVHHHLVLFVPHHATTTLIHHFLLLHLHGHFHAFLFSRLPSELFFELFCVFVTCHLWLSLVNYFVKLILNQ